MVVQYNSLQVIFNEIQDLLYQLDHNCGVDAQSGLTAISKDPRSLDS